MIEGRAFGPFSYAALDAAPTGHPHVPSVWVLQDAWDMGRPLPSRVMVPRGTGLAMGYRYKQDHAALATGDRPGTQRALGALLVGPWPPFVGSIPSKGHDTRTNPLWAPIATAPTGEASEDSRVSGVPYSSTTKEFTRTSVSSVHSKTVKEMVGHTPLSMRRM